MNEWDAVVVRWVEGKAGELKEAGVADLIQGVVSRTWRRNAGAHDESEGDTARSLGVTQSENLREMTLRAYRDDRETWSSRGVTVTAPEQSLLITVAGLSLHPMKSRENAEQDPSWGATRWTERSQVRRSAALTNRARYVPVFTDPFPGMEDLARDPDDLEHAMVVYRGDLASGRTAGWLAVPSLDAAGKETGHPWMGAALLWRDEGEAGGRGTRPYRDDQVPVERFDDQPAPLAPVTLRPARRPSAS